MVIFIFLIPVFKISRLLTAGSSIGPLVTDKTAMIKEFAETQGMVCEY